MIAVMVAPAGDCSIVMTRDCFETEADFLVLISPAVCCEGFAAGAGVADDLVGRFFADFDIEILRSVHGVRRTTEAPLWRLSQRGGISEHP